MIYLKHFLVTFLFVQIITSCSTDRRVRVGFVLPNMNSKRYEIEKYEFSKKVEELGGTVLFASSDNNEEKQKEQVRDLLAEDIDILVLDPVNQYRAAEIIRGAHQKGILVISYDRLVANCDVDAYLTFNASDIGNQMANYVLSKRNTGNYFILGGDKSDINAVLINTAVLRALNPYVSSGKISIVYQTFVESYSMDEAELEVDRFINLSQTIPDAIIASSDMLALGAIKALTKNGANGKVLVTGQGADPQSCIEILKGNQCMTIYKPAKKLATLAAEIAVKMAGGNKTSNYFDKKIYNGFSNIPYNSLNIITVDSSNIQSTVIADGFLKEVDLFR